MTHSQREKKIGMVGIGGSGMQGLAYLLSRTGAQITGTDQMAAARTNLEDEPYGWLDEENFLQDAGNFDAIIFSDAVAPDHPLRVAARAAGTEINYQEAVGNFAKQYQVAAITGTHGKSSTSAMAAHIMIEEGLDPTVLIGAAVPAWQGRHARLGKSNIFLVEADEYRGHFMWLEPAIIGITAIDFDHPDYFHSLKQTEEAYSQFIKKRKKAGVVITLRSVQESHPGVEWPTETITLDDREAAALLVPVPGRHMKANGLIAREIAIQLGADPGNAGRVLATYGGISRRFETLGAWQGMEVISDYGHHPTEIANTIEAARENFLHQRIAVIFEPHTQERLQRFKNEFVDALKRADGVLVVPTFRPPGRESSEDVDQTLFADLIAELKKDRKFVIDIKDYNELRKALNLTADKYDVALAFSAGYLDGKLRELMGKK